MLMISMTRVKPTRMSSVSSMPDSPLFFTPTAIESSREAEELCLTGWKPQTDFNLTFADLAEAGVCDGRKSLFSGLFRAIIWAHEEGDSGACRTRFRRGRIVRGHAGFGRTGGSAPVRDVRL